MKHFLTGRNILTWLLTTICEAIILKVLETQIKSISIMIQNNFEVIFIIVMVLTTIVFILYWSIKYAISKYREMAEQINYITVRNKYYDIAFRSFLNAKPNEATFLLVNKKQEVLFTDSEMKYFNLFLIEQDRIKKEMTHRNL